METINNTSMKTRMINGRFVVGGFLALHGVMNAMLLRTPTIDGNAGNFLTNGGRSWLLNPMGISGQSAEMIGAALALIAAIGFIAGALAYIGRLNLNAAPVLLCSAIVSLATLILFWNDWMIAGALINVVIIVLCLVRKGAFFAEA
jgi:hypothetical protein